jgi:hypothetical protein
LLRDYHVILVYPFKWTCRRHFEGSVLNLSLFEIRHDMPKRFLNEIKEELNSFAYYVGRDNLLDEVKWKEFGNMHQLVDKKTDEEIVFVMPMIVSPNK